MGIVNGVEELGYKLVIDAFKHLFQTVTILTSQQGYVVLQKDLVYTIRRQLIVAVS